MPSHWTYAPVEQPSDLQQGDFLAPSDDLLQIFREVHPHFCDSKYLGFLVLTQSCDLVRRKNRACKAKYIALAVVRPLEQVLFSLLDATCERIGTGIYRKRSKHLARDLIERILNQNEQALGLFYLHPDADLELGEPAVVLLRISVSLRSDHYAALSLAARGRLKPEFQNKLGWLVANLYGRAATRDWNDERSTASEFTDIVTRLINKDPDNRRAPVWIADDIVQAATDSGVDFELLARNDIDRVIQEHTPPPRVDLAAEEVAKVIDAVVDDLEPGSLRKIKNRLKNNANFRRLFPK